MPRIRNISRTSIVVMLLLIMAFSVLSSGTCPIFFFLRIWYLSYLFPMCTHIVSFQNLQWACSVRMLNYNLFFMVRCFDFTDAETMCDNRTLPPTQNCTSAVCQASCVDWLKGMACPSCSVGPGTACSQDACNCEICSHIWLISCFTKGNIKICRRRIIEVLSNNSRQR
jgi:hypothetical protein